MCRTEKGGHPENPFEQAGRKPDTPKRPQQSTYTCCMRQGLLPLHLASCAAWPICTIAVQLTSVLWNTGRSDGWSLYRCDIDFSRFPVSYTHLDVYKRQGQGYTKDET